MPAERFYINTDLAKSQNIFLEDQEFHHLAHVMRIKPNEEVEIVNGQGVLAKAVVLQIDKKRATLQIQSLEQQKTPSNELILAQAIPRPSCLDFILEKGTELGMTQIWLFPTKHGGRKRFNEQQLARMKTITIASMKQCGRLFLPVIYEKPSLEQWKSPQYPAFFGDLDSHTPPFKDVLQQKKSKSLIFFVGPESGFSDEEINILKSLPATGVKLHENILRAETAAIVALALASQKEYGS